MSLTWNELPGPDEVQHWLSERARLRAAVRFAELNLKIEEARMSKRAPRNTAARVIGVDEESEQTLIGLNVSLLQARSDLDSVEAELEMLDYRKEIYKANSFRGRV